MESEIIQKYGNRLRVRVCGLCWDNNQLLVANHRLIPETDFWAPIGGGVEFGETAQEALIREFMEEATIQVMPGRFLFACELIQKPLHALELFFEVHHKKGKISTGIDPESSGSEQILKDVRYMQFEELMAFEAEKRHGILQHVKSAAELKKLTGFYRI